MKQMPYSFFFFFLGFSSSSRDIGFVVIEEMFSLILTADLSKTSSVRGQFTLSAWRGTGTRYGSKPTPETWRKDSWKDQAGRTR